MYIIPSKDTKKFSQPNTGDTGGNLWSTFNVNLSKNKGRALFSRTLAATRSTDDATTAMKLPVAFAYYDYYNTGIPLFMAYAGKMFVTTTPNTGWLDFGSIGEPNVTTRPEDVDMKVFNGNLYATTHGNTHYLKKLVPVGTWADVTTIGNGTGANIHILEVYGDRLYWTEGNNKVYSLNTSDVYVTSGSYTLELTGRNGHISWMKAGSNRIWIGWTSSDGSRGSVFEWDGQSENLYSKEYKIEAQGSCTCVIKNDIPYVLDVEGKLLAFNGSNFQEIARLPLVNNDYPTQQYIQNSGVKLAHFNGSLLLKDNLVFLINPLMPRDERYIENCQAGVWEYTEDSGLTHKYSISSTKVGSSALEYGQQDLLSVGALFDGLTTNAVVTSFGSRQGQIIFGARTNELNSPFIIGIDNTLDNVAKTGYIVTQWLESGQVEDVWKNIIVKYRKLLNTSDKIKVKYRTIKYDCSSMAFNWTSTTTFTVLSSAFPNIVDYGAGDEVEIMLGVGAGKCVNIQSITNSGTTYTVTIDEAITSATGSGYGRFQHWVALPVVNNKLQFASLPIPQYNKDIQMQFKVIFEVTGENELHELIIVNGTETNAK